MRGLRERDLHLEVRTCTMSDTVITKVGAYALRIAVTCRGHYWEWHAGERAADEGATVCVCDPRRAPPLPRAPRRSLSIPVPKVARYGASLSGKDLENGDAKTVRLI